jgi:hypothetical protein
VLVGALVPTLALTQTNGHEQMPAGSCPHRRAVWDDYIVFKNDVTRTAKPSGASAARREAKAMPTIDDLLALGLFAVLVLTLHVVCSIRIRVGPRTVPGFPEPMLLSDGKTWLLFRFPGRLERLVCWLSGHRLIVWPIDTMAQMVNEIHAQDQKGA